MPEHSTYSPPLTPARVRWVKRKRPTLRQLNRRMRRHWAEVMASARANGVRLFGREVL